MEISEAIQKVISKENLSHQEMAEVMNQIMAGDATDAQIGGFLVGLRMKGETVDEITAAATVMRALATGVKVSGEPVVDTCGTGGSGSNTFNVSTASAFVVSAAGAKVAKHGNRSITSRCGSADLLEAFGVNLSLSAEQVARSIDEVGVGFMFALNHHGAMKHAIGPRKEMKVRTIFNLLGPLTNPAGAPNQVMGVYDAQWVEPVAQVLAKLGSRHALVVHSDDGLDEISLASETAVAEVKNGDVFSYKIAPESYNFDRLGDPDSLVPRDIDESKNLFSLAISDVNHPAAQMVALNAGAAIYVSGLAADLAEGIEQAVQLIKSGAAKSKFEQYVQISKDMSQA